MHTRTITKRPTTKYSKHLIMDFEDGQKSNVIYKMTFQDGKTYIGKTSRSLRVRIAEHMTHSAHMTNTNPIFQRMYHCINNNEVVNIEILDESTHKSHLGKLEFLHIKLAQYQHGAHNLLNIEGRLSVI